MSKIIQDKAKILANIHVKEDYYKLAFDLPGVARISRPGQFLMVRINQGYKPFLRRPFSIHKVSPRAIEIIYQVVGQGTRVLSQKTVGEYLDILGPLGNGFDLSGLSYPLTTILVGGGMGVAPLFFLAQRLISKKGKSKNQRPVILIGAKTKRAVLCKKEFASLGLGVKISSDDGSAGFKGRVTELLKRVLRTAQLSRLAAEQYRIYACGPKAMLGEIAVIAKKYGIPAQVSLDEYMACGLGVCLGCMLKTRDGQQLVCKDGPVFDISEISW